MDKKKKILELLNKMNDDSKSVSYEAEQELCGILNGCIKKLRTIEIATHNVQRSYPEVKSIDSDYGGNIDYLPCTIFYSDECDDNEYAYVFKTEWLDINEEEYFNTLLKQTISHKENLIHNVENSLYQHNLELADYRKLKFEDLNL